MEYKQTLNKVRALLSIEVKLAQATLIDGVTILEAEAFEPDYSVGIVTEEGIIPAPVGVHETTEGMIITVEVDGIIKSVEQKAAEEVEVEAAEEVTPQGGAKKVVETISKETFFEEVKVEIEKLESENSALKVELAETKKQLKLASVKPISFNPEPQTKSVAEMTPLEKHRLFKQTLIK